MPRVKGSKNKTVDQKVEEIIEAVKELPVSEVEKAEAIDQLDDLLGAKVEPKKDKIMVGYHPITKEEVWI
jgi:hypothetical protein